MAEYINVKSSTITAQYYNVFKQLSEMMGWRFEESLASSEKYSDGTELINSTASIWLSPGVVEDSKTFCRRVTKQMLCDSINGTDYHGIIKEKGLHANFQGKGFYSFINDCDIQPTLFNELREYTAKAIDDGKEVVLQSRRAWEVRPIRYPRMSQYPDELEIIAQSFNCRFSFGLVEAGARKLSYEEIDN